jgi:hypothetical protein
MYSYISASRARNRHRLRSILTLLSRLVVVFSYLKQRVSTLDHELGKNSTGMKTTTMQREIMAKSLSDDLELLDSLVDCLVARADSLSNTQNELAMKVYTTLWDLGSERIFS